MLGLQQLSAALEAGRDPADVAIEAKAYLAAAANKPDLQTTLRLLTADTFGARYGSERRGPCAGTSGVSSPCRRYVARDL